MERETIILNLVISPLTEGGQIYLNLVAMKLMDGTRDHYFKYDNKFFFHLIQYLSLDYVCCVDFLFLFHENSLNLLFFCLFSIMILIQINIFVNHSHLPQVTLSSSTAFLIMVFHYCSS